MRVSWADASCAARTMRAGRRTAYLSRASFSSSAWCYRQAKPGKVPLQSALLVSRPPVLLREPSTFEREYFRFNTELSHRIQQPFAREHYFKKGSSAEARFDEYYAQLQKTWDGDALIRSHSESDAAAATASANANADVNKSANAPAAGGESDLFTTMPRTTAADAQNDQRSLERALDRTLYLFIQRATGQDHLPQWHLPTKRLPQPRSPTDSLHESGLDAVRELLGATMDIWLVSRLPIAMIPHAAGAKVRIWACTAPYSYQL